MKVGKVAALTWGDLVNADGRVKDEIRFNADQTQGGHPRIFFWATSCSKIYRTSSAQPNGAKHIGLSLLRKRNHSGKNLGQQQN
jgi:hypothetical protein